MTVAGRSLACVVAVALVLTVHTADAQVYTAAKTGGNYMHNYYLPPAASSTPWWPSWAPDGKRIAFAMDGSIWSIEVGGSVASELAFSAREYLSSPEYSPTADGWPTPLTTTARASTCGSSTWRRARPPISRPGRT